METQYNDSTYEDWNQRYNNCYGFLLKNDQRLFVKFVENTMDAVYFKAAEDGMVYHALRNSDVKFEFTQVDNAYFNTADGTVWLMARNPQRQWRRGIHNRNTLLYKLDKPVSNLFGIEQKELTFENLYNIFKNPPDYKCNGVDLSKYPRALSRSFAINQGNVLFYDQKIGTFKDNKITFIKEGELVRQELTDALRRGNYLGIIVE